MKIFKKTEYKKGIALLITMITVSALLLISLAISNISYREQIISYAGRDSKVAFYAADTGSECALFYDLKGGGEGSDFAFATSSADDTPDFQCNGEDANPYTESLQDEEGNQGARTIFYFNVSDAPKACAIVTVDKLQAPSAILTTIESRGYNNTCDDDGPVATPQLSDYTLRNLERALQVTY